MKIPILLLVGAALAMPLSSHEAADADARADYDVVVYGGTSAGVVAAVQASRMQATVVLIEPGSHLGGLSSGGLGQTDFRHPDSIGGLSREFYRRVKRFYSNPSAWKYEDRSEYRSHRHDADPELMFHFEPHVAERIFRDMLAETEVEVVFGERVDLDRGVEKEGTQVRSIAMESGRRFRGQMFIDATYEGDLMATAGVSYVVGRESNATYGETHNGNQWQHLRHRSRPAQYDFLRAVDPYVRPGDPESGTVFGVPAVGRGDVGQGDPYVQAYCFRLCLTNVPENRVPFPKPADYDPARYELLLRYLTSKKMLPEWPDAGDIEHPVLGNNLMTDPPRIIMPNRKSDANTQGAVSFNFVGENYDYPDGDYQTRERIIEAHESWQQGLIWFVANDPRVPAQFREPLQAWGLAKDEFTDNGHWPHQLYVREARRMVGAFVMTQHISAGTVQVDDPVGLGAFPMDSHIVRRYIDEHGYVRNEGIIGLRVEQPYGISYRSLVPKKAEAGNLLVPVCMSASHVAYGSIRMEPVFMVLGQAAATAAVHAIRAHVPVQQVDYAALRAQLLRDGQILTMSTSDRPFRRSKE